ncbi:MAG: sensor domain-containing diguanylate cyclase [Leptolyngbya sp. BL-A-14]
MRPLLTAIQKLAFARDLNTVMAIVRVAARKIMLADGVSIVLRDQNHCFYADEDAIAPLWKGKRFPMHEGVSGWTMKHRQPCTIADIYKDERVPLVKYQTTFVKSLTMVPIQPAAPLGTIGVYWAEQQQPSSDAVNLLQALASAMALALENLKIHAELEQRVQDRTADLASMTAQLQTEVLKYQTAAAETQKLSMTDELTGLYNRRGFLHVAEQQLKVTDRMNESVCLFFIDLDGLKQVNDGYGHEAGDQLLTAAGRVLNRTFRESDVVARLSGDEFAVFVPGCTGTDSILKRLQANVNSFNQLCKRSYPLSMSVGATMCLVNKETSIEQMVAQADALMYSHKRSKRTTSTGVEPQHKCRYDRERPRT